MKKLIFLAALTAAISMNAAIAQNMAKSGGVNIAPDSWLLKDVKAKWWSDTSSSPTPTELKRREPTKEERAVIERTRFLMANHEGRAIALLDGDTVVYSEFKAPAQPNSKFAAFSMGKTMTAMAVGQAVCDGKMKMDTTADSLIPELKGTALGKSTVRDLLTMSSATKEVNEDSTILSREQNLAWGNGTLDLLQVLKDDRVSKPQSGVFGDAKRGDHFAYQSTDPITLGLMVASATGMEFTQYLQWSVLDKMGAKYDGFYRTDYQKNPLADSGISLNFDDYLRFAIWVQQSSKEKGCFGDFVRASQKTQIKNPGGKTTRKAGNLFDGYGYLTWTENMLSPKSAWAVGHGGQRISWHSDTDRMIVVFSTSEDWMEEVYKLDRSWAQIDAH